MERRRVGYPSWPVERSAPRPRRRSLLVLGEPAPALALLVLCLLLHFADLEDMLISQNELGQQ